MLSLSAGGPYQVDLKAGKNRPPNMQILESDLSSIGGGGSVGFLKPSMLQPPQHRRSHSNKPKKWQNCVELTRRNQV